MISRPRQNKPKGNPNAEPKIFYPPSKIEFLDPTYSELNKIIRAIGYFIKYIKAEIVFDIYSTDIHATNKFLSEHLLLDGVRAYYKFEPEPEDDPYTTYFNDTKKKTKKADIIYIKDDLFVRVGHILNLSYFYENGIDSSFISFINNIRFEDYFKVLYFDKQALYDYLSKKLNTTDPDVVQRQYHDFDFSHPQADEPLVDTVQKLKDLKVVGEKIANWSRFLKPLPFPMYSGWNGNFFYMKQNLLC